MHHREMLKKTAAVCTGAALLLAALPAMPVSAVETLTVGRNGTYQTIGEAVAAAANLRPNSETSRVTIAIEPGTYREQLLINTPYLTFKNSNPSGGEVLVTWYYGIGYKYYSASNGYYNAEAARAKTKKEAAQRWGTAVRLQSGAKYFRAEDITFENSFNRYITNEELADGVEPTGKTLNVQRSQSTNVTAKSATERAAAMCVEAENCEFYHCQFLSSQDTLYTASSAYFRECKIQGNTDYIFGSGDVVFDACELCFGGYADQAVGGYITAARAQTNGYLFWNCNVTANPGKNVGAGYFGRPWKDTAHVLFYNTTLQYEGIIAPAGWYSMSGVSPEQATFREYNTKTAAGGNVNTGGRTRGTVLSGCDATREKYLGNWKPYYLDFTGSTEKEGIRLEGADAYRIRNAESGLYLALEGDAREGANIVQGDKDSALLWIPEGIGKGFYMLYADSGDHTYYNRSYYVLNVDGDSAENGANIGIRKQEKTDGILFKFAGAGGDRFEILTKISEDACCLGISGENVEQQTCSGEAAQAWILEPYQYPLTGKLIRSLSVNDLDRRYYWEIVPSVKEGDLIFGDRDFRFSTLPAALSGAEYIRTACDSKKFNADAAELTAAQPITLYAAMDTRVDPLPAWLSGWSKTALTAASSNGEQFLCYAKELNAGDTIILGANGQSGNCMNYAVFAVANAAETTTETTTTVTETTETTTVTETSETTTETTTVTTAVLPETKAETDAPFAVEYGDIDESGSVDVSDAVLLARYLAEDSEAVVSEAGKANADCDGNGEISGNDVIQILKYIAKIISHFR